MKVTQYGTHESGTLFFDIDNVIYKVVHYCGGTTFWKARKIGKGKTRTKITDKSFAKLLLKSIKPKNAGTIHKNRYFIEYKTRS